MTHLFYNVTQMGEWVIDEIHVLNCECWLEDVLLHGDDEKKLTLEKFRMVLTTLQDSDKTT